MIIENVSILAVMMLVGFVIVKTGYIPESARNFVSMMVFKVTLPFLIITSLLKNELTGDMVANAATVAVLALVGIGVSLLLAFGTSKLLRLERSLQGLYICMSTFGNIIFLGYPLIGTLYGTEGLFYAVIYSIINDGLVYSLGIYLISKGTGVAQGKSDLKRLLNPVTISFAVAIILLLLGVKLPEQIEKPFYQLGQCTTPFAMLFIGMTLAGVSIKEAFKGASKYVILLQKMILVPIALIFVFRPLGVAPLVLSVVIMQLSMPMQNMFSVLANEYGADSRYVAETILISMFVSVVSLPFIYAALDFLT